MAFNSLQFLWFFPLVASVYFLLPNRVRWAWLLAASVYFYGVWRPLLILELAGAILVSYYLGLRIEQAADKAQKKRRMKLGVCALVFNLFIFKYAAFFNDTLGSAFGWFGADYPIPVFAILLPVGISFYTFQLIGYLVDVSNGAKAERHFGVFSLYVSYFPKLIAGPIERAKKLLPQLHAEHHFDFGRIVSGLQLMVWGAFQKVVIADRLAPFVRDVYGTPTSYDGVAMALATWFFAFQVYADFGGYTDIALGAARVMGVELTKNFNRPYFANSIQDFWKRWHISLSSWLTDYVYTPITRTRLVKVKLYYLILVSLFITFVVSGLWHGAKWTFVAWGALHGGYLIVSVLTQKWRVKVAQAVGLDRVPKLQRVWKVAVTFGLVCFSYTLFNANSLADSLYIMKHLPTGWADPVNGAKDFIAGRWAELALGLYGIAIFMAVESKLVSRDLREILASRPVWQRWALYHVAALSILVLGAFYDANQEFIYFQF